MQDTCVVVVVVVVVSVAFVPSFLATNDGSGLKSFTVLHATSIYEH